MKLLVTFFCLFGTLALGMEEGAPINVQPSEHQIQQQIPIESPHEFLAWYNLLSQEAKQALRNEVRGIFFYTCPCCGECTEHPLARAKVLKLLVAHAKQLLKSYGHDRIFGLGQSPAYFVETAKLLQVLYGKPIGHIKKIDFSGSFLKSSKKGLVPAYVLKHQRPSRKELSYYRQYLTSLGLDPISIINAYFGGARTIIVDYANSGCGLASFLMILKNWAKELGCHRALCTALHTDILVTQHKAPLHLFINPCKHQLNQNIEYLGCTDEFDDRLVSHFSFKYWKEKFDPAHFSPSRNARLFMFHVLDQLMLSGLDPKRLRYTMSETYGEIFGCPID